MDGDTYSAAQLTFTDSTNFDKFQVGDVVQDSSVTVSEVPDPSLAVDGDVSTFSEANSIKFVFGTPQVGLIRVYHNGTTGGERVKVDANDTATFYTDTGQQYCLNFTQPPS